MTIENVKFEMNASGSRIGNALRAHGHQYEIKSLSEWPCTKFHFGTEEEINVTKTDKVERK